MVADPVPEAAVEAGAKALFNTDPRRKGLEDASRESATVLLAALETGTLIAVPQDEQGRRELVERAQRAALGHRSSSRKAVAVLQALGLLPEQEEARDADGAPVAAPGTPARETER